MTCNSLHLSFHSTFCCCCRIRILLISLPVGLSFFTSSRGHSNNNDSKNPPPTFGVADMIKSNVLTYLTLSPIQYKSTIETLTKETTTTTTAAGGGGSDGATTPTWQIVDLRSMDGGFWISEVCVRVLRQTKTH